MALVTARAGCRACGVAVDGVGRATHRRHADKPESVSLPSIRPSKFAQLVDEIGALIG
jgi:hypothetical protein